MRVKTVKWLDQDALEAEVIITDGSLECAVFCQPCNVAEGQDITKPLFATVGGNIVTVENQSPYMKRETKEFSYEVVGKITDKSRSLVQVGKIMLEVGGYFPGDSKNGDMVQFYTDRIDL